MNLVAVIAKSLKKSLVQQKVKYFHIIVIFLKMYEINYILGVKA